MRDRTAVYEPDAAAGRGFAGSLLFMAASLVKSRELVWQLFRRDFLSVNNQSLFGNLWVFLTPVISIVSWVLMNRAGILKPGDVGVPYPVYVLVGGALWGVFTSFAVNLSRSMSDSGALLMQINFPHEALLAKQALNSAAGLAINSALIAAVLVLYGVAPAWRAVFFPLALLPLLLFGMAIGISLSVAGAVVADVSKGIAAVLSLLMYFTPVIYSPRLGEGTLKTLVELNPLTYLVSAPRDLLLHGTVSDPRGFALAGAASAAAFLLSLRMFYLTERKVIERL